MKKVLIIFAVLAMASAANAALVMTVGGSAAPADYSMAPTDTIDVGVLIPSGDNVMGYDLSILVGDSRGQLISTSVDINPSGKTWHLAPSILANTATEFRWTAADISAIGGLGLDGEAGLLATLTFQLDSAVTIANPLVIDLYSTSTEINEELFDTQVLGTMNIIPEPATLVLLGLGGLLLRRRK